jgi:hypothetical protein
VAEAVAGRIRKRYERDSKDLLSALQQERRYQRHKLRKRLAESHEQRLQLRREELSRELGSAEREQVDNEHEAFAREKLAQLESDFDKQVTNALLRYGSQLPPTACDKQPRFVS